MGMRICTSSASARRTCCASARSIRLRIETDANLLPTADNGREILAELDNPWVGITYGSGNFICYTEASPEDDFVLPLPYLGHVHLKDKRSGKGIADFSAHPACA